MNYFSRFGKYSSVMAIALALLVAVTLLAGIAIPAQAQTESVLFSFSYGAAGAFPLAGPIVQGTTLYGTASQGGVNGNGTVWAVNTRTGKETTLYEFQAGQNDGYTPMGGLAFYKGSLYGTTCGGPHGNNGGPGMVFKLTKSKKIYVETILYVFDTSDGACPGYVTPVFDKQGNLYGTTEGGGSGNTGTVFKLSPSGALTTLHNFCNYCTGDAQNPQSGVTIDKSGNIYGTTQNGGTYGYGTIYEVTAAGSYSILYSFMGGSDGYYPLAPPVVDKKGNLYGTTASSDEYGTVWKFTPKTGQKTILHDFVYQDGQTPWAGALVFDKVGNLYGTTAGGGTIDGAGSIFELAANGTLTTLWSFSDSPDGDQPYGSVAFDKSGNLYTTTTHGGSAGGYGTVIKLIP